MKEYHVDLNSVNRKPVILYSNSNAAAWANDYDAESCRKLLEDNAAAPLENLILNITQEEIERLHQETQELVANGEIPEGLANEMLSAFGEKNRLLLAQLAEKGVHELKDLKELVAAHKQRIDYLDEDSELLMRTDVFDEDHAAIAQLSKKVAAQVPALELIEFINERNISRYFPNAWQKMPSDYDPERIAEIVEGALPGRITFTKFYGKFVQKCRNNYKTVEKKLTDPVFLKRETYGNFPGIRTRKCRVATNGLPAIDLGEIFDTAVVASMLARYPEGFIVSDNEYHCERVVLPNRKNIKIIEPAGNSR